MFRVCCPVPSLFKHSTGYKSPVPIASRRLVFTRRFVLVFGQSHRRHWPSISNRDRPRSRSLNQSHGTMLPAWLQRAQSNDYLEDVLDTLEEREELREDYRSASKPSDDPIDSPSDEEPAPPPNSSLVEFYSVSVGGDHRTLNRYIDVEPYNRTRLDPGGRYLNANWVRELHGGKWWIATQAPLPNTAYTFLSVLMEPVSPPGLPETRVRTVVQLTRDLEGGRRKAHPYFPDTVGQSTVVSDSAEGEGVSDKSFKVTLKKIIEGPHCTQSTVSVTPRGENAETVDFNHLLYTAWPDHGVPKPDDHQTLINFVAQVDEINRTQTPPGGDPDPPVMINCSAGIGRTGTFITLSSLLRSHSRLPHLPTSTQSPPPLPESPLGSLPPEMAGDLILQEIDSCREQRPGMVQTNEQIAFLYLILGKELSSG